MNQRVLTKLNAEPKRWIYQIFIALAVVVLLTWSSMVVAYNGLTAKGATVAVNILRGLVTPDTSMLFTLDSSGVPYLLLETMCIAFLGTVIGAVLAIPLSFLSAKNVAPKPVTFIIGLLVMAIRTIPAFVYGLMFIRVTGPGAYAGVLTMSITSVGMLTKRNIEVIEDLDTGVLESLDAAGCNRFEKIRYGIIPQLYSNFVSNMIYRFDINMKDATVLGLVGAGGIGVPLINSMNSFRWNQVGALLIGLIVIVLIIEFISTKIRNKLARG